MSHLDLVALIVEDYDAAIDFFVRVLRFELVEDVPSTTNDGRPKRWVVVRPPGAATGVLLARADGDEQRSAVGQQFAGRVGLFLRVDPPRVVGVADFDAHYARLVDAGVTFGPPACECANPILNVIPRAYACSSASCGVCEGPWSPADVTQRGVAVAR